MTPVTPVPVRRVAVYELMNRTLLESLLVITSESENSLRPLLRREPPAETRRWNFSHDDIAIETLSPLLREDDAEAFAEAFLKKMGPRTWRFRVWRP